MVRWALTLLLIHFWFARSRWGCEAVVVVVRDDFRTVARWETVRPWLREAALVWRPRPAIRPKDPDREKKLRALRALLKSLPADETAVFMDVVGMNLNPKVLSPDHSCRAAVALRATQFRPSTVDTAHPAQVGTVLLRLRPVTA